MAFRLTGGDRTVVDGLSLLAGTLGAYDMLVDNDMSYARDDMLQERSAYEMVRDQLTDTQRAELEQVDAFWRANEADFNRAFRHIHAFENKKTALKPWIEDADGNTPPIPRSHWWWWPIGEGAA